ncbi:hexosaminidase D-like [Gigantopelta aegis]|uniref:hexosaminidase D-like n=1 Tax=Gigantopelta aegis TaxID=1735272 RepID=UPI001B887588|nr:hexosaminidase D-like [Gigantopelta aegis]
MSVVELRIVHLDLKGAPPKVEYFQKLFPLLSQWGCTGLLIEYEDMFPYTAPLEDLAAPYAYSREAILEILQLAAKNGLSVIPLVQTFGHLEFMLKHERFSQMRELSRYPMALCPSHPDSLRMVCTMIDQVMQLHPGIEHFHIGCDEVYHIGHCPACKSRMVSGSHGMHQMFFSHVASVAKHIRMMHPTVIPLIWDDMLRNIELPVLIDSGLKDLVEPMIWHYLPSFSLPTDLFERLSKVFPTIWLASAFKGATGVCRYVTDVTYHIANHLAWISSLNNIRSKFTTIKGIVLTGWQRYDHYAVLCELLPQAIPSLAMCLAVLLKGEFTPEIHMSVSHQLNFTSLLPLNPFHSNEVLVCDFPGSDVYCLMLECLKLELQYEEFLHNDMFVAWMNEYNVKRNFINVLYIEPIIGESVKILEKLVDLQANLQKAMATVFYDNTVIEWLQVVLSPKIKKMSEVAETGQRLLAQNNTTQMMS